ncbi:carboxy terminal-processing peptidase [Rudanella lutea]|uniref:carboxy terminal-processing peptidase n=1 Tax=Rudanella lutea TaxID=451374 RepID=UPI0003801DA9|nr:carboxy terminal-processing peptidase [Rudanella lutea]
MKKYLVTLLPVLILSIQPDSPSSGAHQFGTATAGASALTASSDEDLKPTISQERVEQTVARLLTTYHYRKVRLNDSLSSKVWDNYLEQVDRNKTYLLASDVAAFDKYRTQVDDALVNGDLSAAYEFYNVFRKRYTERSTYVQDLLKKPFTFTVDETLNTNREKAPWAKDAGELNEIWRKMLKNQALELKLAGQKDSAITATLTQRYKNLDKAVARIRSDDVFQMYMNAFAEALDPHTNYLNPSNADRFNQEMSQSLEGIGAMLQEDGEYIKISNVIPGGPAFKSKQLNSNDKIVGVAQGDNGPMVSIIGYRVDDAVKLIKGPKATVVRLQIRAADALASSAPKEVRLVREKIKLEEQRAKKEVIELTENGRNYKLGVINIPLFYRDFEGARKREENFSSTTSDVKRMIDSLKQQRVDGIVIDLRNNGGGSLTEAINLTGLFIQKGPVVQVREGSGETEVYSDLDPSVTYDGPMAVLVNRFSASASEIFAAAIQDYKRGLIVGGQTFGKGTVQTLIDLNQWMPKETDKVGQVKMTIQKFYRVNGSSTQHKGVTPDIELPSGYSAEEFGESSQPSALPWDQIPATRYDLTNAVNDKVLNRVKERFETRLKNDPELKKLSQELAEFKKAKENTVVSLQETKRRKERDEAEKKREALRKEVAEDPEGIDETGTATANQADKDKKKKKDLYLTETGRILADYIVAVNK